MTDGKFNPEQLVKVTRSSAMAERPCVLDTSSINVQRYSQNHAQNWIFGETLWGHHGQYIRFT